jgi:hypothetical protein
MHSIQALHTALPDTPPENFCISPFMSIRQNPYGRNSPCAFGAGEWHHGDLTPRERWDSPELNELRNEFIKGNRPEACHRCWAEEDAGKESLRQRQLQYFPNEYNDFIKSGKWLSGPKTAVFKVSNVCNLACRSCGGWDSNTFTKEGIHYKDTYQTQVDGQPHNRFIPLLSPKHMDFSQYYSIADQLEKIDFFGGEPFLNITQLDLLEYLTERGLSKKITLYYSTNCTNFPTARLQRAWDKFKRVEIAMSIDGLNKEFEYTRWPGKWDEASQVVDHIIGLKDKLNCEMYTMASVTLSAINLYNADKLLAWAQDTIGSYYINMVNSPSYLSVHILPEEVKTALLLTVQNKELIGYMQLKQHDPQLFKQFIIWMKRQDLYRQQDFKTVYPDYYQLLQPYWDSVADLSEANFYS